MTSWKDALKKGEHGIWYDESGTGFVLERDYLPGCYSEKKVAKEKTPRPLTKQDLHISLEALRYFIEESNDIVADDDRGRANDALCLVLFDDGSGMIGTTGITASIANKINTQCEFDTIEQAVDYLADWMLEKKETGDTL